MKKSFIITTLAIAISACGGVSKPADPNPDPDGMKEGPGFLSGETGNILDAFRKDGGSFDWGSNNGSGNLGVNGYIWRAALETMNFLPLQSADSAGGVIITDWGIKPDDANERVKATVYIFGKQLTPQSVQVKLFKQRMRDGLWLDVPASASTSRQLEDSILTKARRLKVEMQAR